VLVDNGTLALIQYCGLEEPRTKPDRDAVLDILARIAPDIAAAWPVYRDLGATRKGAEERSDNVSDTWAWLGSYDIAENYAKELFYDVHVKLIPKESEHTPAQLNAITSTMSMYARLSPDQRIELKQEYEQLGRKIRSSMVAALVTAKRVRDED
jgi:hypothetical protein